MTEFERIRFVTVLILISAWVQFNFAAQPVISPPILAEISFADKSISLVRYDLRERFDREQIIIAYNHSVSLLQLKRANRYFPLIEPVLKQYGIPDDFKYLAVVESNLDPRALSGANAAGLWQMMPKTATQFGLEVNDEVDERYHLVKATEAACKYLRAAYNKYKNWATVAASYNAGMGRISDELDKQNVDEAYDLLLNTETSRYLFRILAIKQFFENPVAFGFQLKPADFYQQIATRQVSVNQTVDDWAVWAEQYGISYSILKDFNVWLRARKLSNPDKRQILIEIPVTDDLNFNGSKIKIHNPKWIKVELPQKQIPYIYF